VRIRLFSWKKSDLFPFLLSLINFFPSLLDPSRPTRQLYSPMEVELDCLYRASLSFLCAPFSLRVFLLSVSRGPYPLSLFFRGFYLANATPTKTLGTDARAVRLALTKPPPRKLQYFPCPSSSVFILHPPPVVRELGPSIPHPRWSVLQCTVCCSTLLFNAGLCLSTASPFSFPVLVFPSSHLPFFVLVSLPFSF